MISTIAAPPLTTPCTHRAPRARPPTVQCRRPLRCNASAQVPTVTEKVQLGQSGVYVTPVGVGAWSWGDRSGYWGWEKDYGRSDNEQAYRALMDNGLTFIDTAEVYGFGKSEELLGEFMRATGTKPTICTKYAPQPWRFTADSVVGACKASLGRLGVPSVALYIQHWPGFALNAFSNDAYLEGLARCQQTGLCDAVGVSNFNASRLRDAHATLKARGVVLSSNQVQYNLLYRTPERNGVLEACQELGITPLCQGLLTGKYTSDVRPDGPRGLVFGDRRIQEVQPLLAVMREISQDLGGKTLAQIAINWCLCKGVVPIPGAKNEKQVADIAGALGWRLDAAHVQALDDASSKISVGLGAPFENW